MAKPRARKTSPAKAARKPDHGLMAAVLTPPPGTGWSTQIDEAEMAEHGVPANATILDYIYATQLDDACRLSGVRINGRAVPLSARLVPGDDLEFWLSDKPTITPEWLTITKWPDIHHRMQLDLELRTGKDEDYVEGTHEDEKNTVPRKQPLRRAQSEITGRSSYKQPSRVGKKLIGAYIDEGDVALLKMALAARGLSVQEFFEAAVSTEIAAARPHMQRLLDTSRQRRLPPSAPRK